ncbi:hypothetical protein [Spirosoma spitsbergense]|uniref:hypothetical protein n=1 Tax=Spirosoma spitsbergense TaxID=431554 RepID=UPI000477B1CB|nr:hypothetical protein [Spirosoma spitsbergense]
MNSIFSNTSALNVMNRNEKLKILQSSLQGQTNQLQQLHRERRKKSMPYLEAHAIIDAHNCPPELLDITVLYGEIDERPFLQKHLRDWLKLLNELGKINQYGDDLATGFIDAKDSQYDAVKLNLIKIRSRDFSYWNLPDMTIGDLRAYYNQSEASCSNSFILLMFDTDMSQYTRYTKFLKSA